MTNPPLTIYAPRWPLRSLLLAGTITLGMYMLLPYLQTFSGSVEADTTIRSLDIIDLPPPPLPPPPEEIFDAATTQVNTPKPQLDMPRQMMNPAPPSMNLEMALGDVRGDFSVEFGVRGTDLTQQVRDLIFEIGELDQPPRPLARLDPVYPPRARMRRIEGEVVTEFVVDPDGSVKNVQVVSSRPGEIFTNSAIRAIQRWRFSPGMKDGQAVTTRVRQKVTFSLQ